MSENKGLLPIVTPDIEDIVQEEFEKDKGYIVAMLDRLYEENQAIYAFLDASSEKMAEALYIGTFIYRCLEIKGELPVVTLDAYREIEESFEKARSLSYLLNVAQRLKEDNPWIVKFAKNFSRQYPTKKYYVFCTGIAVYSFLEKQAEYDVLQKPVVPFDTEQYPLTFVLRKRLNIALAGENYEIATKLRDEINKTPEPL